MLVQAQEGFGAWNDAIYEFLALAKELNRTLVEPCVRNGCLEPCRCGAVAMVDIDAGSVDAAFAGGADPLDRPDIDYVCEPHTPREMKQDTPGRAYPLRAYVDLDALTEQAGWPHVVGYDDWCKGVAAKDSTMEMDKHNRWILKVGDTPRVSVPVG